MGKTYPHNTVKYISEGQARMIDLKTERKPPLAAKTIKE
jgi:hypothetical protein